MKNIDRIIITFLALLVFICGFIIQNYYEGIIESYKFKQRPNCESYYLAGFVNGYSENKINYNKKEVYIEDKILKKGNEL